MGPRRVLKEPLQIRREDTIRLLRDIATGRLVIDRAELKNIISYNGP